MKIDLKLCHGHVSEQCVCVVWTFKELQSHDTKSSMDNFCSGTTYWSAMLHVLVITFSSFIRFLDKSEISAQTRFLIPKHKIGNHYGILIDLFIDLRRLESRVLEMASTYV